MTDLESILEEFNNRDHIDEHSDDSVEEYITWLVDQNIALLRKYAEEEIEQFQKEAVNGRSVLVERVNQFRR